MIDDSNSYFNFDKKANKTVPVKLNLEVTYKNRCRIRDSVHLKPDHIEIWGAEEDIKNINYVETEMLSLKNLEKPITQKVKLKKPRNGAFVELVPLEVEALLDIVKYTEGSIELTPEAMNLPPGARLRIFPPRVTVKFNAAYEDLQKISEQQFRATVDIHTMEKGSNQVRILLSKIPKGIDGVRLLPEKVEVLINKE